MGEHIVAVPVISSHVLHGLPAFVRDEIGEKALARANRAAGFDAELIEGRNFFIPHHAVVSFVDAIVKAAGEPNLGLLLAPTMSVATYGSFGRYIFEAETLDKAIKRSIAALHYHSTQDRLFVSTCGDEVRYSYGFALAGAPSYAAVAAAAAGELLSVFKAFLPSNWRPVRVELDIPKPSGTSVFEDVFQCPVIFNAPTVTVVAERHRLMTATKRTFSSIVTIADVARDRAGGAPQSILDVTFEQIRAHLLAGNIMIDEIARSMATSVRTLQRELNATNTDFRSLTNAVRAQRAIELLEYSRLSITSISEDLGYSSPAGFTRAFRKATGWGPREFRAKRPVPATS
ncbi:AraC family transcriptional regulator ligand-binding domain-containing protein [Ensifer sp. B1-9]|uniref:AraC family transcriptional regulator n=1 Tax=Ensifer sp. B1-9 TaxID=3141455 RepID=UPI003D1E4C7A